VSIDAQLGRQAWLTGGPAVMANSPATAPCKAGGNTDASGRTVKRVEGAARAGPHCSPDMVCRRVRELQNSQMTWMS
jgi:hypothetical protein